MKGNLKNYPDVQMWSDYTGVYFTSDLHGDKRFKSAAAAQEAVRQARIEREQRERTKMLNEPDRVEIDLANGQAKLFKLGQLYRVQPLRDKRDARQQVFSLCDEVNSDNVIWL